MFEYKKRISLLEKEIKSKGLDSFLVTDTTNVSYLSGFKGKDSTLLFAPGKRYFITDSRYIEDAQNSVKGFEFVLTRPTTYEAIKRLVSMSRVKRIGFESMNLPYEVATTLKGLLNSAKLIPMKGVAEVLRSIKDRDEIAMIKDSIRLTKSVFKKLIKVMKPGVSERALSQVVEVEFINSGARPSFEPIIASGVNSSKPHARTTEARLAKDSFVMVDIGCDLNGYNADITRMVLFGKIVDKIKKIYHIVQEAQKRALRIIRPGVKISDVDQAARSYIQDEGFGECFGHSLGHGVGMEVHEEPTISRLNQGTLNPGMVFTVEPAIYIPKFGGARTEDMVLVTNDGHEVLTR